MLLKSLYRSELSTVKKKALLDKLDGLVAIKRSAIVIDKHTGGAWRRYYGKNLESIAIDSSLSVGALVFESSGAEPGVGSFAQLVIQDLTFDAVLQGTLGNDITIEYENYTAAVKASKVIQDLTYTADTAGAPGNSITIAYVDDGTAGAETVGVVGSAITVHMEAGVSTATQIKAAVDGDGSAAALVDIAISGTGSNPQTAVSATALQGGSNAIGAAGSEVVTVLDKAIKVKLQNGVSTATQVKAAIDAEPSALDLVAVTISGTGSNAQTAPTGPTNLAGADNIQTFDLADIVDIRRLRTKKYRIILKPGADPA